MTCRHKPGDRSCSSHPDYVDYSQPTKSTPTTPDSEKFEILDAAQCGKNLVMKVKYPNCFACAYEGTKVLVYLNKTPLDALKWRKIDPHFADPKRIIRVNEAPPPAARFPASVDGWTDAVAYATSKK